MAGKAQGTKASGDGLRRLVIVESPSKIDKISTYLGPGYQVEASYGHIRDLPQPSQLPDDVKKGPFGKFAVDVEHGFEPYYVVDGDKKKKVSELKRALKDVDELILATDRDREGEAIAWHLVQALEPRVPYRRMVFGEITREAIQQAARELRDIDNRMVDAQETRRILDRLYGYELSPVLWRKVRAGLSAGRVQSVATRLCVERERERMAFVAAGYADITGTFQPEGDSAFSAKLSSVEGKRVASGRDFADDGTLKSANVAHLDVAAAEAIVAGLAQSQFAVRGVEEKPYTRRPAAPFITSTLQQEASRKLRLNARQTMRTAQGLYERGYITYMRTDSIQLSSQALAAARAQARELYGPEYVPDSPRNYTSKTKNAQEGHEAIRPAGETFRTPAQVSGELRGDDYRLYDLIWKRTVASQMHDARGTTATVRLGATTADGRAVEFSASGTIITFRGFLAAYEEGRDATRDDEGSGDEDRRLPQVTAGRPADGARPRRRRARDHPARPVHRGQPHQDAGGEGDRAPLDVPVDHLDHRRPRVRLVQGLGPRPELARVRRDAAARGALPQARRLRLHRRDGERPRRDLPRRGRARGLADALLLRRRRPGQRRRRRRRAAPRRSGEGRPPSSTASRAWPTTSARSTPARSRPSRSARASSCAWAATARTSRAPTARRVSCSRPRSPRTSRPTR